MSNVKSALNGKVVRARQVMAYNKGYSKAAESIRKQGKPLPKQYRKYYEAGAKAAREGLEYEDGLRAIDGESAEAALTAELNELKAAEPIGEEGEDWFFVDDDQDVATMDVADADDADDDEADLDDAEEDEADIDDEGDYDPADDEY